MVNIFDLFGSFFLIAMYLILCSRKSFIPKIKIYALLCGIVGAAMYVVFGFMTQSLGLIIMDTIAIIINIFGVKNSIKEKKEKGKELVK